MAVNFTKSAAINCGSPKTPTNKVEFLKIKYDRVAYKISEGIVVLKPVIDRIPVRWRVAA